MMASHTSSNGMEIDQFPHPASTNSSRRYENLPSIGAVFRDLPLLNNHPVPGSFGTGPESEPRVPVGLPPKKWGPSDSDRRPYSVPKQQHIQLHGYNRQHHNHNHPYSFPQPENSSRCHPQHLQLGSGVGKISRRSGGSEASSQHFYPHKPIDRGTAREPEYSWGADRLATSVSSPGLPGAPTSSHVQQQHEEPQHQRRQQQPLPPPPPPPILSPINSWANSNRPEHSGSPQLSPAITDGYSQDYSVNDSDAGNGGYSENGDSLSDLTNSVHGDSYSHTGSIGPPYTRQFSCAKCKAIFKCDSLRRKHEMKHTKPFKCPVLGCKRAAGFSSVNDMNRHMNSVHRRHISGPAVGYDCQYDHCRDNGKIFFRLDNFRNHLKKKHGPKGSQEGLEEFLKRAETECRRTLSADFTAPYSPSSNQFMDTRSEPGLSDVPSTPIATDSPGLPPISPTFRRTPREPFQTTAQPQVPSFPSISESSFGHGKLVPLAPKNPVPEPLDAGSDDRMELDFEEPIARVYNPSGIKPSGGPSGDSTAIPGAKDREPEATISNNRSMKRKRRISEIDRMIEKLTSEKDKLVYEEQVEFNRGNYPTQSQRASQDSQAVVSGPNGPNSKRIALGRIEENDQDHDMRGGNEPGVLPDSERSGTSHALRGYIQQATTQDPWPGRWLNPSTDPHSPDAADKDRASALSPQGTMTVSSPTGTTAATEVSQQPHPAEGRLRLSPPLAMGLRAQRGAIPNKQASSKYTGNAAQLRLGPGPSSGLQKGPATCLVCAKTFHRPSELKKHMKRHSRPFACTFRGCGKSFGSKNDWKRHENSQHFQLELWKCGVIAPKSTGLCGKLSFRRESHITHLKNAHNIIDKQEIQKWTNEAHIGRNNFKTFWCGFCPKERGGLIIKGCVVQLKKKGLDGWDERFDHLGKHFEEGNHIKDYTFHEDDVFGDLHSTEEDEDEDDEVDDIREEDDNTGEERPIIESTAPPEEEKAEKLQPSQLATTQKDEKGNKKDKRWYCCNQNIGRCSDPGPYTVGLTDSCIQCCHERCKACSIEERG